MVRRCHEQKRRSSPVPFHCDLVCLKERLLRGGRHGTRWALQDRRERINAHEGRHALLFGEKGGDGRLRARTHGKCLHMLRREPTYGPCLDVVRAEHLQLACCRAHAVVFAISELELPPINLAALKGTEELACLSVPYTQVAAIRAILSLDRTLPRL